MKSCVSHDLIYLACRLGNIIAKQVGPYKLKSAFVKKCSQSVKIHEWPPLLEKRNVKYLASKRV